MITDKPLLLDKLDAELASKVVRAIVEDNERALRAKKKKARDKKKRRRAKG